MLPQPQNGHAALQPQACARRDADLAPLLGIINSLCYARAVGDTMLHALGGLAPQQSKGTEQATTAMPHTTPKLVGAMLTTPLGSLECGSSLGHVHPETESFNRQWIQRLEIFTFLSFII